MSSPPSIPVEDRISALPDPLICHILSFLPTKLAVTTNMLSKRWNPLWRSVLTLDFDEESFPDFAMFRHSAYSVIVSREITAPIRSFRIKYDRSENIDLLDVNRFVHAAAQRQIENVDLELPYERNELTTGVLRVLSCKTLVVLKLKYLTVYDVPQLVHLPLLKTLNLVCIKFIGSFAHFNNLVRGCPALEDFRTQSVEVPVYDDCDDEIDSEFEGFPYLLRANFSIIFHNPLLRWFHNTKFLYAELYIDFKYEKNKVPIFPNLTDLELVFNMATHVWKYKWVIEMLQHFPKLQNLTILEINHDDLDEFENGEFKDEELEKVETVPECLLSQLRTCCLEDFFGYPRDLQFAKYIMMNSKVLSTMTVKSIFWSDENRKQHLSSYPMGSPTCKLLFD